MGKKYITLNCFSIIFCLLSLAFTQEGSFKIGNIKYDYNNLEFSFKITLGPGFITYVPSDFFNPIIVHPV